MALTLSAAALRKAFPNAKPGYIDALVSLSPELEKAGILGTAKRIRHFLAQGAAETAGFTLTHESGNYSAAQLLRVFPKYFKSASMAHAYANKPMAIFNRTYGGRLGNKLPGDGYRYRGRGIFQLTGKSAYKEYGERLGLDLVGNPDLAAIPENSVRAAILYWADLGLNEWADKDDILAVSRGINGGNPKRNIQPNGMEHRRAWLAKLNKALTFGSKATVGTGSIPGMLREGDTGPEVERLQSALRAKGYAVGAIDGIYGANTRRAVAAFQAEHGLDGQAGIWQAEYAPTLEASESIQAERKSVTAEDLRKADDPAIKRLTWIERLAGFFGLGWLVSGTANDQISTMPELITQWRPLFEAIGPAVQWLSANGWLLNIALILLLWLTVRSVTRYLIRAYRFGDYQGPYREVN